MVNENLKGSRGRHAWQCQLVSLALRRQENCKFEARLGHLISRNEEGRGGRILKVLQLHI